MDEVVARLFFLRMDFFGGSSDFDRFEVFFTDISFSLTFLITFFDGGTDLDLVLLV